MGQRVRPPHCGGSGVSDIGDVAKMWQDDTERPAATSNVNHVCAGRAVYANNGQHRPSPVMTFPWYF